MADITGAFCAIADLQKYLPGRTYSATSNPSSTQVEAFCVTVARELKAHLDARGLSTPTDDSSDAYLLMRDWNSLGGAIRAEQATVSIHGRVSDVIISLKADYDRILMEIRKGIFDATIGEIRETMPMGNEDLYTDDSGYNEAIFKQDMDF